MALRLRGRRLSLLIFSYFISELSSFSFISQKNVVTSLDFIKRLKKSYGKEQE